MVSASTTFRIDATEPSNLRRVREAGTDDFGNPLRISVTEDAGAPLRCCLREATARERIALTAFSPFTTPGPYAEVGPIFIHVDECPGYVDTGSYPQGFRHQRQVFRPYDAAGNMVYDALEIVDGADAEHAIERILARPDAEFIHSRNVLAGCYMFAIRRTESGH